MQLVEALLERGDAVVAELDDQGQRVALDFGLGSEPGVYVEADGRQARRRGDDEPEGLSRVGHVPPRLGGLVGVRAEHVAEVEELTVQAEQRLIVWRPLVAVMPPMPLLAENGRA